MDRYARKRAWYRKTLSRSRRAARRSDRWQGICGSPRRAEYETGRIEGQEAPAAGSAQRSWHVEAPKSGKTFKGAIQTTDAFDLSGVPLWKSNMPRGMHLRLVRADCGGSLPAKVRSFPIPSLARSRRLSVRRLRFPEISQIRRSLVLLGGHQEPIPTQEIRVRDRKSTRLNSSHANISYAVFCLKKKTHTQQPHHLSLRVR